MSMGAHAARKALDVLHNSQQVVAIELIAAAQAVDFGAGALGRGTDAAYRAVRDVVPRLREDRVISTDCAAALELVRGGALLAAVTKHVSEVEPHGAST